MKNIPIYTTYLGFLNKHGGACNVAQKLGSCFVYYIARDRGNNAVAPSEALLAHTKRLLDSVFLSRKEHLEKIWQWYKCNYLAEISSNEACKWMEKRAGEANIGNILLICFEKDATHCHRRILALEMSKRFNVEYKGEVQWT